MSNADKVLVLLTDNGPMRTNALGKATKCGFISTVCRQLEKAGKVKMEGTHNAIVYVPGQDITDFKDGESAPPSSKGKKRKKKNGAKSARRPYRKLLKEPPAPAFIAAVTADTNLVLIGKMPEPLVFSEDQTEKIATLMFAHFKG